MSQTSVLTQETEVCWTWYYRTMFFYLDLWMAKVFKLQCLFIFGLVVRCSALHPAVKSETDLGPIRQQLRRLISMVYTIDHGFIDSHLTGHYSQYHKACASPLACVIWGYPAADSKRSSSIPHLYTIWSLVGHGTHCQSSKAYKDWTWHE